MSETRVLLGRVGGGAGISGLAPVLEIREYGAGTSEGGTKRNFTLEVDCSNDLTEQIALISRDFIPMHFRMRWELFNFTPGRPFRKQVIVRLNGLWQREFYDWNGNEQNGRSWFRAMPIYIGSTKEDDWVGRENTVRAQAMRKDHGAYTVPWLAMEWWRWMLQRKYGAQPIHASFSTDMSWRSTTIAGQRYRVRLPWQHFGATSGIAAQELYNNNMYSQYPWLLTYGKALQRAARESQGMSGRNQHMGASIALLRATFEYYGPEAKMITYDLFHNMPGANT